MMKTIGLTYDLEDDYVFNPDDPPDANVEFDSEETIQSITESLIHLGYKVFPIGNINKLLSQINLIKENVDLIFNFAENLVGRNRESQIPILLEALHIPYVGSDGLTMAIALDKLVTKKLLVYEHIPTPNFIEARTVEDIKEFSTLRYPLMVKPRWEGSSKGISKESRVQNRDSLIKRVKFIVDTYKQPALVEEFISGSEYTVPIIGNTTIEILPPMQIQIKGKNNLGKLFYIGEYVNREGVNYIPLNKNLPLRKTLESLALKTYKAVECRDLGRVDFRVDQNGNPFVLEINPLPALIDTDAFAIAAAHIGISYKDMIEKILTAARNRYNI